MWKFFQHVHHTSPTSPRGWCVMYLGHPHLLPYLKPQTITFLLIPVLGVSQEVRVCQKILNSTQWHSWKFCINTDWGLRILNEAWSSFPQQGSDPEGSLEACMPQSIKLQLHFWDGLHKMEKTLNWENHHCVPQDNIKLWLWFEQHFHHDKNTTHKFALSCKTDLARYKTATNNSSLIYCSLLPIPHNIIFLQ